MSIGIDNHLSWPAVIDIAQDGSCLDFLLTTG
jgi:hypothetical protein